MHFRAAYTSWSARKGQNPAESRTGTVQPNFLSGIYGGISLHQYHDIQQLPVAVAAPIAMVGYSPPSCRLPPGCHSAGFTRDGGYTDLHDL